MRYLEATGSHIIESSSGYVTVRLSPEADRELTNRPYYWGFVDRTGVDPETMTFTFVFDPEQMPNPDGHRVGSAGQNNIKSEYLTYGHARLQQIFKAVSSRGRFIQLYEQPPESERYTGNTTPYTSWLVVNYNVELLCDMKKNELHSLGISLSTGDIMPQFHKHLLTKPLTPKLPAHTHIRDTITLERAKYELDKHIESMIEAYDHQWAADAVLRMQEEVARMNAYYNDLVEAREDEEEKNEIRLRAERRLAEIEWQYKPRIQVTPLSGGMVHLITTN